MKSVLFGVYFVLLFSCTNSVVDLSSTESFRTALFKIVGDEKVSNNSSPTIQLLSYHPDMLVNKLAIYDSPNCASAKVGEIYNSLAATISATNLVEGAHNFFYKPVYDKAELNTQATCIFTGLIYTIDKTAPIAPTISFAASAMSKSSAVLLDVVSCQNTTTGASSISFSETAALNLATAVWAPCTNRLIYNTSSSLGFRSIYAFTKDLAGNISPASMPIRFYLGGATVSFNLGGAGAGDVDGGFPYYTNLDASVSGTNIDSYRYKFGLSTAVDCSVDSPGNNYNGETANSIHISKELTDTAEGLSDGGSLKLCIIGKNSDLVWQPLSEATTKIWTMSPKIKNLSTDFTSTDAYIKIDNTVPSTPVTTNYFSTRIVSDTTLSCTNCTFALNNSGNFNSSGPLHVGDLIRFQMISSPLLSTTVTGSFALGPITFSIKVRTKSALRLASVKRIFITRNTYSGDLGGISGANSICDAEAFARFSTTIGSWNALLSDSALGINKINGYVYRDALTSGIVFDGTSFVSSFYFFIDGTKTNGGGAMDSPYVSGAIRSTLGTHFWYGGATDCNCDTWTSVNPATALCAGAVGGNGFAYLSSLTFESSMQVEDYYATLPGTGNYRRQSCSTPQHLVCFEQ
ncbi:MAG: hypothetical protein H7235_08960 [Bdellovibrionaceae bacterium]|nr:hypothetical protein [Pseudobdellovibrionaceae bacterium]